MLLLHETRFFLVLILDHPNHYGDFRQNTFGNAVGHYFLKPFCKKEKLYPEQVRMRYGGLKTNPKFRGFIDQMEF